MSYPINYPTPQGANVQIFRGSDTNTAAHVETKDWVKPQGASFVWFTLIGGGGGGGGNYDGVPGDDNAGGGGASGNITNFMCPAFFLPDVLQVGVGQGGAGAAYAGFLAPGNSGSTGLTTRIVYQQKVGSTDYLLLFASGGGGGGGSPNGSTPGTGGTASGVNAGLAITAAGFYSSTAGQNGASAEITPNNLTFLLGGSGGTHLSAITAYYGYTASPAVGYGQIQPIIQSISGGVAKSPFGAGGCGAAPSLTSGRAPDGGDGLVVIVTW